MTNGGERVVSEFEDGLAPVTPLFGDRSRAGRDAPATPPASSSEDEAVDAESPRGNSRPARPAVTRALPDRPRRAVSFTQDEAADEPPVVESAPTSISPRREDPADAPRPTSRSRRTLAEAADVEDRDAVIETARVTLTRSLGRRGLSIAEARSKLRTSGLEAEEADVVVEDFVARGWLDDAVLAEQLVHSATTRKDMGSRAIRQLLTKRMVAREVADAVVAELPDDDAERALEFATSKARTLIRYDDDTAMRRLMGQLARRGFGGSVAGRVARQALSEARADSADTGVRFR